MLYGLVRGGVRSKDGNYFLSILQNGKMYFSGWIPSPGEGFDTSRVQKHAGFLLQLVSDRIGTLFGDNFYFFATD